MDYGNGNGERAALLFRSVPLNTRQQSFNRTRSDLRSDGKDREEAIKPKKMANKVSNISDLIHKVAASCLLHPLARGHESVENQENEGDQVEEDDDRDRELEEEEEEEEEDKYRVWEEEEKKNGVSERVREMEEMVGEVFEAVWAMKKAYVKLQEAHCPWDPDKMRVADVAVVGELRKLGRLRERWRRGGGRGGVVGGLVGPVREVVAPYEAAVAELKREVRLKEVEVESLKEKLRSVSGGRKGRLRQANGKVSCPQASTMAPAPTPELFQSCMSQVKEASKTFATHLLSLMRSAHWDIVAAVRSIEGSSSDSESPTVGSHHAKHAVESYVCRKIFQGFENETFYIDGSLSSLLHPEKFRRDCFTQFRDMKAMDPVELLGILPTCHLGKFCGKKFLAIVHPKMEESLFGDLEQRRVVLAGNHPRSEFYNEFLGLAKAVWLLHLLAFALDPAPSHFQASKGADFHPEYMESVVRFPGGRVPAGQVVGFSVTPGFKLGNGSAIKARVYLVSRT